MKAAGSGRLRDQHSVAFYLLPFPNHRMILRVWL